MSAVVAPALKRGIRIEYRYASGNVVQGRVVRRYSAREIAAHANSHGAEAAAQLPEWVVCELTDEHGSHTGACHVSQLRVTDNRCAA